MADTERPEMIYLSWGGSGRGVAFREAYNRAVAEERGIVYLAILDAPTFSDLDGQMLDHVVQELTWLLEAQLRLVDREEMATRVPTRTLVRDGDVADEVSELVEVLGTDLVLIGAPIPLPDYHSAEELMADLATRTGATVELIGAHPTS